MICMGRPPVLTVKDQDQLALMIEVGVTQDNAARVLGVSRRTVARFVARERAAEPQTLQQVLDAMPPLWQVLADLEEEAARPARRVPKRGWRAAADQLAEEFPQRWGGG